MAYYGMTNEYVKETNAANKVKKDIERQEILKEEIKIADNQNHPLNGWFAQAL